MRVLNFGSLNIDNVYRLHHIVRPGETLSAFSNAVFAGGKGLNQSIALARAGAEVYHAGMIGRDGMFLKELLEKDGVNCSYLAISDTVPSGNALIQVADDGENSIVLFGGANQAIDEKSISCVLENFSAGDFVVLQNEISVTAQVIREAHKKGLKVFFNPAPMSDDVADFPLELVDTLIVNETEMAELKKSRPDLSFCNLLLTLGSKGAAYYPKNGGKEIHVPACKVEKVVDTTGAGDTFIGYFAAEMTKGLPIETCLAHAGCAAANSITKAGAAVSIPFISELDFN